MEHGLKLIAFYVQKHKAVLAMCHNPSLVRDKPLGAPASVKLVFPHYPIYAINLQLLLLPMHCNLISCYLLMFSLETPFIHKTKLI